jgi:hypothetical protein
MVKDTIKDPNNCKDLKAIDDMFVEIDKFYCKATVPNTANCPCRAVQGTGNVESVVDCVFQNGEKILTEDQKKNIAPLMKKIEEEFNCAGLCSQVSNYVFHYEM